MIDDTNDFEEQEQEQEDLLYEHFRMGRLYTCKRQTGQEQL